jgi:hypothetical protein
MPMGRDRGAVRWDVRQSLIHAELERIERDLARLNVPGGPADVARQTELARERERVLSRLRALGPSPRAKMG